MSHKNIKSIKRPQIKYGKKAMLKGYGQTPPKPGSFIKIRDEEYIKFEAEAYIKVALNYYSKKWNIPVAKTKTHQKTLQESQPKQLSVPTVTYAQHVLNYLMEIVKEKNIPLESITLRYLDPLKMLNFKSKPNKEELISIKRELQKAFHTDISDYCHSISALINAAIDSLK